MWKVYSLSGMGTLGALTLVSGVGVVLEGVNARFQLVIGPGGLVDIAQYGIRTDGVGSTTQDDLMNNVIIAAARDRRLTLTGSNDSSSSTSGYRAYKTLDFRTVNTDFGAKLRFQFGTLAVSANPRVKGDFYSGGLNGSQTGITTQNIQIWNPETLAADITVTLGIGIRAGGNGSNSVPNVQSFWVSGDGHSSGSTESTCLGIRYEDNDSSMAYYRCFVAYCYVAHGIQGPAEKHIIDAHGFWCDFGAYLLPGASADEVIVNCYFGSMRHAIWEAENSDTSVRWYINMERRDQPLTPNLGTTIDNTSPTFYFRNGKHSSLGGRMRGQEGYDLILVDKPQSGGVDTMHFDNFTLVHGYGRVLRVERLNRLSGQIFCKDWEFGPDSSHANPTDIVWLKNIIQSAASFQGHFMACQGGIRIGDVTSNRFPNLKDLGVWSVQHNTANETAALTVEKMTGGQITFIGMNSYIEVAAAATGDATIQLPYTFVQRALTAYISASAVARVGYTQLDTTDLITALPDTTAPTITSSDTLSVNERASFAHLLTADEPVTWAIVGGADAAKFTLNGASLTMPAKTYDTPDDANTDGVYAVDVEATDIWENVSTTQNISVTLIEQEFWQPTDLGTKLKNRWTADDLTVGTVTVPWTDNRSLLPLTVVGAPVAAATSFNATCAGVTFDGAADYFETANMASKLPLSGAGEEIYTLADFNNTGSVAFSYGGSSTTGARRQIGRSSLTGNYFYVTDNGTSLYDSGGSGFADPAVIVGRWTTTSMAGRRNGADFLPDASTARSNVAAQNGRARIAAQNGSSASGLMSGVISEIIVTTTLTTEEMQKLEGWLAWKGGIQASLDAAHPYRSVQPPYA